MAISYTWKITTVKTIQQGPYSDAVAQVYWSKTGTDENGNVGIFNGTTPLSAANTLPENFISYEQLSHDIVLTWVQADIDSKSGFAAYIDQVILDDITNGTNKTTSVPPLVWTPSLTA